MGIWYLSIWPSILTSLEVISTLKWKTCFRSLNMVTSKSMWLQHDFSEANMRIRWTQFLVVITTHSDPERGDLHVAPNNTGAVPVDKVSLFCFSVTILIYYILFQLFAILFPDHFCKILQREKSKNILNLLSCGALLSQPSSRDALKDMASLYVLMHDMKDEYWHQFLRDLFDKILCFSQPNFQPSSTHKFVMDLALHNFVFDWISLINVLREQYFSLLHWFQPESTEWTGFQLHSYLFLVHSTEILHYKEQINHIQKNYYIRNKYLHE